jgi:hypothetical protein
VRARGLRGRSFAARPASDVTARLALHRQRVRPKVLRSQRARGPLRHPRLPDDGEWQCADSAGAVLCAGGEPPAGVAAERADTGWFCGARSGAKPLALAGARAQPSAAAAPFAGPRVCLDLDPDFPDGTASHWRCRYAYESGVQRICQRDGTGARIGDACNASRPCVDGSHCSAGYCIVPRPLPDCWLGSDCKSTDCRFGSCAPIEP